MSAAKADNCLVAVFADESCIGNGREGDNPGGAGALIELRHPSNGTIVRRDLWISERATTNNRMALRSVIEAMDALGAKGARCRVTFTTAFQGFVAAMTGGALVTTFKRSVHAPSAATTATTMTSRGIVRSRIPYVLDAVKPLCGLKRSPGRVRAAAASHPERGCSRAANTAGSAYARRSVGAHRGSP